MKKRLEGKEDTEEQERNHEKMGSKILRFGNF
jgi:hypothetical protein